MFVWHSEFFARIGSELGVLLEVADRMTDRSDLRKVWIKVDFRDVGLIPGIWEVESARGRFRLGVRCFR